MDRGITDRVTDLEQRLDNFAVLLGNANVLTDVERLKAAIGVLREDIGNGVPKCGPISPAFPFRWRS